MRSWSVVANQYIAIEGELVAMARSPQAAREIVDGMTAQEAGKVAADAWYHRRLLDLREEFGRQLLAAQRRAERAEAQLAELRAGVR